MCPNGIELRLNYSLVVFGKILLQLVPLGNIRLKELPNVLGVIQYHYTMFLYSVVSFNVEHEILNTCYTKYKKLPQYGWRAVYMYTNVI